MNISSKTKNIAGRVTETTPRVNPLKRHPTTHQTKHVSNNLRIYFEQNHKSKNRKKSNLLKYDKESD